MSPRYSPSHSDSALSHYPPYTSDRTNPPHLPDTPNLPPSPHPVHVSNSTLSHSPNGSDSTSGRYSASPYDVPNWMPHLPHDPAIPNITWTLPKSYISHGFDEMWISIQEDFGGIRMRHHRVDLINRLDYIIMKLDRGVRYFSQYDPEFDEDRLGRMKDQYRTLREVLLEVDVNAICRASYPTVAPLSTLTPTPDEHRIPRDIYVRTPPPIAWLSALLLPSVRSAVSISSGMSPSALSCLACYWSRICVGVFGRVSGGG